MIIHNATSAHNFTTVSARIETYGASTWLTIVVDGQVICSLFPSEGQVEYLQRIADAVADVNLASADEEEKTERAYLEDWPHRGEPEYRSA